MAQPPRKIGQYTYAYWSPVSIQILNFTGNKLQNKDTQKYAKTTLTSKLIWNYILQTMTT